MATDLKKYDIYQIKRKGIISDYDQKLVIRLYQPLIGTIATMLYLTLLNEISLGKEVSDNLTHERLLSLMQIKIDDFIEARKKLESIGLLKTFIKENKDQISLTYLYSLNSPKSPKKFFEDPILSNLLLKSLGENEYYRTQYYYLDNQFIDEDFIEISSQYEDSFPKNETQKDIKTIGNNFASWKTSEVNTAYNFDDLINKCSNFMIPKYVFTDDAKKEIYRLKILFNLSDDALISAIKDSLELIDNKKSINLEKFNKIVESYMRINNTKEILDNFVTAKRYDKTNPLEYYKVLLGIPSLFKSDIIFIKNFMDMKIPNGVINTVLDYCFKNSTSSNSNITKYIEKVMASVVKDKCKDAYQTMEYFKSKKVKKSPYKPSNKNDSLEKDENDENDMEKLLKIIGD